MRSNLYLKHILLLCAVSYISIWTIRMWQKSWRWIFWENRETFQIQLSLKAYLFQAAKNKCLNELRKKKETVGLDRVEVSTINTSVSTLETEELYRLIQEAVFSLPDKCRNIFLLSRSENLTNQEIAQKLNISVKTVEGQITTALKKIKKFLGDQYSYLW